VALYWVGQLFQLIELIPTVFRESADKNHPDIKVAGVATVEDLLRAKFFIHFYMNNWLKWPRVTKPPVEAREVLYLTPEEVI
jgi:hypothetical protein